MIVYDKKTFIWNPIEKKTSPVRNSQDSLCAIFLNDERDIIMFANNALRWISVESGEILDEFPISVHNGIELGLCDIDVDEEDQFIILALEPSESEDRYVIAFQWDESLSMIGWNNQSSSISSLLSQQKLGQEVSYTILASLKLSLLVLVRWRTCLECQTSHLASLNTLMLSK